MARPRVALVVETSLAPGREIVQGVARYARDRGGWDIAFEPGPVEGGVPEWLRSWGGDGVIARVGDERVAEAVRAAGVPVVDVLGAVRGSAAGRRLPLVRTDDGRIGAMAAEHLKERVAHHFGFVGLAGMAWSDRRRDAFAAAVATQARTFDTYEVAGWRGGVADRGSGSSDELVGWVAALPKPLGLMVCCDGLGLAVLDACRRAGVDVPGDVAVVGVDDDEPLCEVADPALSSVWPDHSQVGYEAARLLDRLMAGGGGAAAAGRPILVPPRGVVTRRSTDVSASHDPAVAAAIRLIRDRACAPDGLTIDDVAARTSVSRSSLQRRFRLATGRTLHDEMLRVRLSRARGLLAETDLSIAAVAEAAGFRHAEYMGAVFRKKLGVTPARYRRALRGRHRGPVPL